MGHLSDSAAKGDGLNHKKLANDFGKLGSAAFSFLLLPVAKHSSLFAALRLSEVHIVRLHICAGCIVLFGGMVHGLYYTYIWIMIKEYSYRDVFPMEECWSGLWEREYDKECHSKLVNLLGIVSGISLLVLGTSSLYWVRRRYYRLFYSLHIVISIILLFGLVMHYNKMIWYMSPSLLYYLGQNVPICVESVFKWWRSRRRADNGGGVGGIRVEKVVCIPDSGGCVELSFSLNNSQEMEESIEEEAATEDAKGGAATDQQLNNEFQSFYDTIGKYIQLHIPKLSTQSHPFTIFTHPNHPSKTNILFRPCGSFTTTLSKQLKALILLPEPTPSELIENHHLFQTNSTHQCAPKMMLNGIRNGTSDMFEKALGHDKVVIVAGGVGIVSYLSLIHALRLQAVMMMMMSALEDGTNNDNDGVAYDESMTSHEAYNNSEEDLEENGTNTIPNGRTATAAAAAATASPHTTKRIDIHWMSRDEGLIQHVVQNYLVPFCSHHEGNTNPISIRIMVHHTSPPSSSSLDSSASMVSRSNSNDAGIDSELATTTWQPNQHQHVPSSMTASSSIYEGNKPSPFQNILPTITLASILFGGLVFIHHCYENVQQKHVVETRSIAVLGILVLAMVVSLVSNGVGVLVMGGGGWGLFYSKFLFMFSSYAKLENSSGDDGAVNSGRNLDGGVIECGQVVVDADATGRRQQQLSNSNGNDITTAVMNCSYDDDDYSANHHCHSESPNYPQSSSSPSLFKKASQAKVGKVNNNAIMSISHSRGRPDLSMIVRDSMMDEQQQREVDVDNDERSNSRDSNGNGNRGEDCRDGMMDVGIFMCGPTAMSDSVRNAIKKEEERERALCKGCIGFGRKPVAVYQEVFEL